MRLSGLDFLTSRSDMDTAKTAMLTSSSPSMTLSQDQQPSAAATTNVQSQSSTMLDHELLQHYAYLRYGEGGAVNGGRKQHVCPVKTCGRRFSTPGNLSRHKRLHGPIKPLKCPVDGCICAFRSENKLEKHMKFHLGIPVHVCPVPACGKTFSTAGNLNRHIKGHHPHVDPFDLKLTGGGGNGSVASYSASTSSSCDEYESSVGGDEVVRERFEEEAERRKKQQQAPFQLKREPTQQLATTTAVAPSQSAGVPGDHLDALVAILDQDIGANADLDQDADMPIADLSTETESESMLSLLLTDKPPRKYSLLDDMIRFHINHFTPPDQAASATADDSSSASDTWVL
ncbi:Zinc finger protein 76 [Globisporangium polare]